MSAADPWLVAAALAAAALTATSSAHRWDRPLRQPLDGPRRTRRAVARRWSAGPVTPFADPALAMDLLAAALLSGAAVPSALSVVAEALSGEDGQCLGRVAELLAMGASQELAWEGAGERWSAVARCLALAAASGAPTAALLRRAARQERSERAQRQAAAAQRLGVWVLLPMGTCALPGFVALGVVPLVLALAGSLAGA